jgi:tetratricopeptide (TPR) repeat protein
MPVDVYVCNRCHYTLASEDWHMPAEPPVRGSCRNCGGRRRNTFCTECGLTEREDAEVHDELRQLIDPTEDLLTCAGLAADGGRKLIALKLATAAIHETGEAMPRLLRISLLQDLGELQVALSDCREWVRTHPADGTAWTVTGEIQLANLLPAEAQKSFLKALELSPDDHLTRARVAVHMLHTNRFARARSHAERVMDQVEDGQAREMALDVLVRYTRRLQDQGDVAAVRQLIDQLEAEVTSSATLLATVSWLRWKEGNVEDARTALREARKLDPTEPQLEALQKALGINRWGWLPWN